MSDAGCCLCALFRLMSKSGVNRGLRWLSNSDVDLMLAFVSFTRKI